MEKINLIAIVKLNKILLIQKNNYNENKVIGNKSSKFNYVSTNLYSFHNILNNLTNTKEHKILKYMKNKINVQNVTTFYQFSNIFNILTSRMVIFNFIERCFTMVVETENFLELDYTLVVKILESSQLNITSELEVFDAADAWVRYKIKGRGMFANGLLKKVRLTLLSESTLKYLLKKSSLSYDNTTFVATLTEVLYSNQNSLQKKLSVSCTHRYCDKNKFNILICGGKDRSKASRKVKKIDGSNLKNVEYLKPMVEKRKFSKAVCVKGEVYVFGGYNKGRTWVMSVEKYSPSNNTWKNVSVLHDDREHFCVCAFMNKIFIIGAKYSDYNFYSTDTSSCLQFDTKDCKWTEAASMIEARTCAACAVFQGNIVVSGGRGNYGDKLNSVESYDAVAEKWSPMPSMINSNSSHKLVVAKNKLFVIGTAPGKCEVFDNICRKFIAFKFPKVSDFCLGEAISIGSKIIVFRYGEPNICYNIDKDEWTEDTYDITENLFFYCCLKIPVY